MVRKTLSVYDNVVVVVAAGAAAAGAAAAFVGVVL